MPESHEQSRRDRLARAYQSLEGLSCGDASGECFFGPNEDVVPLIRQRAAPAPPWTFTDDTMMAISVEPGALETCNPEKPSKAA